MKLPPNPFVDLAKLRDYCLSPAHPVGKQKARVFLAALGIGPGEAEWLRDQLLAAALRETCVAGRPSEHGQRYELDFRIECAGRVARIRSAWFVRAGEKFPRLTSCYIV